MSKKLITSLVILVVISCLALFACAPADTDGDTGGNKPNTDKYYTVTFDSQGGSYVKSQGVLAGSTLNAPSTPTNGELIFKGWYKSTIKSAAQWDFATDKVNANLTLYAFWEVDLSNPTDTLTFELNSAQTGYIVTGDEGEGSKIVIPDEYESLPVVGIGDNAFSLANRASDITSVTIPDTVTSIGESAFADRASDLKTFNLGTHSMLSRIEDEAFSGCRKLASVYLPAGVTAIGDDVFASCGSLDTISVAGDNTKFSGEGNNLIDVASKTLIRGSNQSIIPSTVTKIGRGAFTYSKLTTLTIPVSVTSIEEKIILNSSVTSITYEGTEAQWNAVTKANLWNEGKTNVTINFSDATTSAKILVAYFSCTNHTEDVAQFVSEITGGTLYRITPETPYTEKDLDHTTNSRANQEQGNPSARPAISGQVDNIAQYDIIYLGYPIWFGEAPKIIYTFVESYDLSGKTIVPFCTSGSSGIGSSAANLHASAPFATWLPGNRFSASSTKTQVSDWIQTLVFN